jgi:hypothetical protein
MDEFQFLTPYFPDLPEALKSIASLHDDQFKVLQEAVLSPDGFDVSVERCRSIAEKLKIDAQQVGTLLSSLEFLYLRSREWVAQGRDVVTALREFALFADLEKHFDKQSQLSRLETLLSRNPSLERRRKIKWLQTGILNTATAFASFVELRPSYTEDRATIEEFIPVIIFRIITESGLGEDNEHIFQLTPDGLVKLRAAIDDMEKKLKSLQADKNITDRLLIRFGDAKEREG